MSKVCFLTLVKNITFVHQKTGMIRSTHTKASPSLLPYFTPFQNYANNLNKIQVPQTIFQENTPGRFDTIFRIV